LTKKIKEERRERKTKLTKNKRKEKKNFFFKNLFILGMWRIHLIFFFLAGVKFQKKWEKKNKHFKVQLIN